MIPVFQTRATQSAEFGDRRWFGFPSVLFSRGLLNTGHINIIVKSATKINRARTNTGAALLWSRAIVRNHTKTG
jgi:hypothetical protein